MAFINTHQATHDDTHEVTQETTQDNAQHIEQHLIQYNAQDNAHEVGSNEGRHYVRTQGRKGHKKPRINLAFDSEAFLDNIRKRADKDGMSITQFVNEAVAYYIDKNK